MEVKSWRTGVRWSCDIVGPFVKARENNSKYTIVFIAFVTKWVECASVPDITAETVATVLMDQVIARHGAPAILKSDRGSQFLSEVVPEVNALSNTKHVKTTSFHPACNVERATGTIVRTISTDVSNKQDDWSLYVQSVFFAQRIRPSIESTL